MCEEASLTGSAPGDERVIQSDGYTNDAFQRVFVSKIPASKVVIISEGEMDELISMLRDDLVSKVVESARS